MFKILDAMKVMCVFMGNRITLYSTTGSDYCVMCGNAR
jgi:hypothetical protein